VFNATFSNISAISERPVLVVEEATRRSTRREPPIMGKQLVIYSEGAEKMDNPEKSAT
jgi:hypothetical protein